ncbi:RagB/SusD family nutrient uptake outer membrane protein [Salegentibacter salegens]|uniref:Starch-binding associating with outer membrane n=1 Tax=Salegentibacter salegens TaxID=143223 RepID=A0A1M7MFK2_9FLAO|nr:RagB/SusD family nutrient uptake outer membrane protein [Salegentibacter salegens]PRX48104.1 putative outer membrane starch-binding protein [Salegentibacter salegens]SHM89706.1 Starch-binding associating with outer membrane [Salegentibacter salegens]
MKRYNNIFNKMLLLLLLAFSFGCSEDYLEDTEEYNIDSENYFNSEEDYYNALIGVYDILQSTYVNVLLGEIASDNTLSGGESANDVIGFQQVDEMTHTPVNDNLDDVWDWNFAGVQRANYVLEFQDKTDFEGREMIIAEVRFLRAYFTFELVKWFGPIPLKGDERFVLGDETSVPRASTEEVYAQIESDLHFAIDNLDYTAPQTGRATKGAAMALLGKAHLYKEEFDEAANVLTELINNGPYALANFDTLFEQEGENNEESVFEVQYTGEEGAGFDCLQCSEGNVAVGFQGIRNYSGPVFEPGFSFNVPVQEAYDMFTEDDIRRDLSVLDIEAWAAETGATYAEGYKHTGYFNRKYLPRENNNVGDANLTQPNNYRSIRYADVLLMAAEALNRGGRDDSEARTYLNEVRDRAGLDGVEAAGNALTEIIYEERRKELVGEGHRFFDLVRTGRAADNIDGFTTGKNELFPIPLEEIEFSQGNWEQNPGY